MFSRIIRALPACTARLPVRCFATKKLSPLLSTPLKELDPYMFDVIEKEKTRQRDSVALIPSENFTSFSVLEALGSIMQNKYSEGYPGQRYYGGNQFIDMSESKCRERALEAFKLDSAKWGVNVQPLSGSPCNFEVYTALLQPHDRIMSLDLPHGGHLSHGYQIPGKKISATSIYFEVLPYRLNEKTGIIDYDLLEKMAPLYRPKLIICGASAYPRHIDYARMRKIANSVGAYLMMDMAHIAGLIAGGVMPSPFEFCDIVTTTTHKSLRGPRGAMIFFRKGVRSTDAKGKQVMYDLEPRINGAVFPGHQGGPHNHTITALSVALKQAALKEFNQYQTLVIKNCKKFADTLMAMDYKLVTGGTDNHLMLVDLRNKGVDGAKVELVCEQVNIACNKNMVPGDKSALTPGGLRVGSPAMTSRGADEEDFEKIAKYIDRAVKISLDIQKTAGDKTMKKFRVALKEEKHQAQINELKEEIVQFARTFPVIGFDATAMKYTA